MPCGKEDMWDNLTRYSWPAPNPPPPPLTFNLHTQGYVSDATADLRREIAELKEMIGALSLQLGEARAMPLTTGEQMEAAHAEAEKPSNVDTWPEWKRNLLGRTAAEMGDSVDATCTSSARVSPMSPAVKESISRALKGQGPAAAQGDQAKEKVMSRFFQFSHELIALAKEASPLLIGVWTAFLAWTQRQHSQQLRKLPGKPRPKKEVK